MTTTLNRVRVLGDGLDATMAKLRLASVLSGSELRPPGLAPAALLFVRRVGATHSASLPLEAGALRPPPEWESAFVEALERARRGAAHPAREAVPATAEAVLFADRAELLACLARDALDGTVASRWWWASALAAAGARDPVVAAWLTEPRHVPAALELLASWRAAVTWVQTLPAPAASELAKRVLRAFEVPVGGRPGPPPSQPRPGTAIGRSRPAVAPAPWSRLVPEADEPALAAEQRQLLGVALLLRRAPAFARTATFARAFETWRTTQPPPSVGTIAQRPAPSRPHQVAPFKEEGPPARRSAVPPSMQGTRPGQAAEPHEDPQPAARASALPPAARPAAPPGSPPPPSTDAREQDPSTAERPRPPTRAVTRSDRTPGRATEPAPKTGEPEQPRPPTHARPAAPPRAAPAAAPTRSPLAARASPATTAAGEAQATPQPVHDPDTDSPARPVETDLGGLFYLLNLALFLGLYGDFTRPREPGIALDPWDLVELLGVALLEARPPDPIWGLLAELAGRDPGEPPGRGYKAPRAWRAPPAWLEQFEHQGAWRWSSAAGTLRIVHPHGFTVTAVPRTTASPLRQLRRELARLGTVQPARLMRGGLANEPRRPLERWIARLAGYADARLRRALALESTQSVAAAMLEQRALVYLTPTHVDVVYALAELPIAVRYAGLDRTPGWIPATGRFVALHFQ